MALPRVQRTCRLGAAWRRPAGAEARAWQGELDSKARVAQEAKLAELQAKVEDHARTERERKYAVMYHRVRPRPRPASAVPSTARAAVLTAAPLGQLMPPLRHVIAAAAVAQVKFFDRVKVERRLKQLEKGLKEAVLEGNEEAVKVAAPQPLSSDILPSFDCAATAHRRRHMLRAC